MELEETIRTSLKLEETIRTSLELDECFKSLAPQPRVGIPSIRVVGVQGTALSKPLVTVQGMLRSSHV